MVDSECTEFYDIFTPNTLLSALHAVLLQVCLFCFNGSIFCLDQLVNLQRYFAWGVIMIWLYLFSGGMALYMVETADVTQPWHVTALISLLLCALPASIDNLLNAEQRLALFRFLRRFGKPLNSNQAKH